MLSVVNQNLVVLIVESKSNVRFLFLRNLSNYWNCQIDAVKQKKKQEVFLAVQILRILLLIGL